MIWGRNTTTAPTPAITPLTNKLLRSPGGIRPATNPPHQSTPAWMASMGRRANVKMLWNISAMIITKMSMPHTLCVSTRSSLSLNVS